MSDIVARLRAAGCVFAEDEARLLVEAGGSPGELEELVARRVSGEPLEYVLGWAAFAGLRVLVEPGVFVPRPRTEFLVAQAIAVARAGAVVVDLCCGTGALGLALSSAVTGVELHSADSDPIAVHCARRNLSTPVYAGDLFAALPTDLRGRVDVLLANVPYVPTADLALLPAEAREHEPRTALDGGADGLDVLRRVASGAPPWLARGGVVFVETSAAQAPSAVAAFASAGLSSGVLEDSAATVVRAVRKN